MSGGLVHGGLRGWLWLLAVGVDLLGGMVGFYVPELGRSTTADWTIEGNHLAERCQAFILIALGESIVVTGGTLSQLPAVTGVEVGGFVAAFSGAVAFWCLYFDAARRAAPRSSPAPATRVGSGGRRTT